MFRVALPVLILAGLILAGCYADKQPGAASSQNELERVQMLAEQLVAERELDSDKLYLVPYSSEPEHGNKFVPVALPLHNDLSDLVKGNTKQAEVGGHRFIFWDMNQQADEDADGDFLRGLGNGFIVTVATRNGTEFPPEHLGASYSAVEMDKNIDIEVQYLQLVDQRGSSSNRPISAWESGPIAIGAGSGRYVHQHFDREKSLTPPNEALNAFVDFGSYAVSLSYWGPSQMRSSEEAQATKEHLLEALRGVIVLEPVGD